MTLSFVYLSGFLADCRRLKVNEDDLRSLEIGLLQNPDAGKVVARTGGVRKLRFAPPSWHQGKRGAMRVLYSHFVAYQQVYFFVAYGKDEQDNLTPAQELFCRTLTYEIGQYLRESKRRKS